MYRTDVVTLTQQLVKIPSITAIDSKDYTYSEQTLDLLEKHAAESGAQTWRLPSEGGHSKWSYQVDNLYAEWTFGTPKRHLVFMGHTDVVPAGDAAAWSSPPFSPEIRDGFLYGRGTTDMKGAVASFFCAMAESAPFLKDITIGAIITADEEWAAINGSRHVLSWLKDQGRNPDAVIVGEPSSRDALGTHIKLGRRGSLVGYLTSNGVQGHAAYPEAFKNANRGLSLAMTILQSVKFDDAYPAMPATNFEPIATQSGDFNASAIVPGEAKAMWNIRYTPRQTPQGLVDLLKQKLENPPEWAMHHPDYDALRDVTLTGNLDTASLPYVSEPGLLTECASSAIQEITGQAPQQDCSGGTTDGRFVPVFFPKAEIVEIGPPERGGLNPDGSQPQDYLTHGGMHQVDERIALDDLVRLQKIYSSVITKYSL